MPDQPIFTTVNPDPVIFTELNLDPAIDTTLEVIESFVPGPQGPVGPQGVRGSLYLGAYPSFVNLPPIDGVDVAVGDYALVQDTSTMWQIR